MKIEDFINNLKEQFNDTDASEITAATKFQELEEWSSLTSMLVVGMIDDEYGIQITGKELKSVDTVQSLFDLLASKK